MKKRSTLLKVMSIILIVLGGLSLLGGIFSIATKDMVKATYEAMGMPVPTTFTYVLTLVSGIIVLVAGILGLIYKSKQSVLIMGIILLVYYVGDFIYSVTLTSFSAIGLVSFIIPILYLWGWYQSN